MLTILRRPAFATIWFGSLVSLTGDWLLLTGLPLVVYRMTGSTLALGATAIAMALPRMVVASIAGVFVDRWDRRKTMLICNVLLGLALLPLLLVTDTAHLWLVGGVLLLEGSLVQFYKPAETALVPRLVAEHELSAANALNGLAVNVARLCGPAIGALLAATGGLERIALADAGTFLVAALTVAAARLPARLIPGSAPLQPGPLWRDWLAGIHLVRAHGSPRVLITFMAITGLGEGIMGTLFVPFATRVMHGTDLTYGALVSAQAVGGLFGSAATAQLGSRFRPGRMLGVGAVLLGAIDLLIFYAPLVTPFPLLSIAFMVLVGLPAAAVMPSLYTLMQTRMCDEQRGRLMGAGLAAVALTGVVGMLTAGCLGEAIGIVPLLTVQSACYIIGGSLVLSQLD